jgi:hypothetical protein
MYIPVTILNKFIHGAWQGLIKIEEFIIADKQVTGFCPGEGPSYLLIIKNNKLNKYFKVEYTVVYKKSYFMHDKIKYKPIVEVYPEKKEFTVYTSETQILEDINKKFEEEFYG